MSACFWVSEIPHDVGATAGIALSISVASAPVLVAKLMLDLYW